MDQNRFDVISRLLFPRPPASYTPDDFPDEIIWIPREQDPEKAGPEDCVPCLFLQSPYARFIILYFHSNAEDLGRCYAFCSLIRHQFQVHVLAVEYPGYGICPGGQACEESVVENGRVAFRFLREVLDWPLDGIILLGRSIGCGPALTLAKDHQVYGVVLVCPFLSVQLLSRDLVGPLAQFIAERFPNKDRVPMLTSSLLIVHGKKDTVVPWAHGKQLYDLCRCRKRLISPENMEHNTNLHADMSYFVLPMLQFFSLPDYSFDELRIPSWAFDKERFAWNKGRAMSRTSDGGSCAPRGANGLSGVSSNRQPLGASSPRCSPSMRPRPLFMNAALRDTWYVKQPRDEPLPDGKRVDGSSRRCRSATALSEHTGPAGPWSLRCPSRVAEPRDDDGPPLPPSGDVASDPASGIPSRLDDSMEASLTYVAQEAVSRLDSADAGQARNTASEYPTQVRCASSHITSILCSPRRQLSRHAAQPTAQQPPRDVPNDASIWDGSGGLGTQTATQASPSTTPAPRRPDEFAWSDDPSHEDSTASPLPMPTMRSRPSPSRMRSAPPQYVHEHETRTQMVSEEVEGGDKSTAEAAEEMVDRFLRTRGLESLGSQGPGADSVLQSPELVPVALQPSCSGDIDDEQIPLPPSDDDCHSFAKVPPTRVNGPSFRGTGGQQTHFPKMRQPMRPFEGRGLIAMSTSSCAQGASLKKTVPPVQL